MITIGVHTNVNTDAHFEIGKAGDDMRLSFMLSQGKGIGDEFDIENRQSIAVCLDKKEVEELIFALQSALKVIM